MRKTTAVAKRKRKSDGESPEMRIEMWPVDRPIDYPKNARKWSQAAIDKVTTSLREFGFRQPIVVDKHDVIIIGHLRRVAARAAGFTHVPVHIADLPAGKVRQLRLMDNRSHDEAQWDMGVLAEEMAELSKLDLDLSFTGFDEREYVSFMAGSGLTDPDEVPEAPAIPVTQAGDLWLMGDHRLLCGDSAGAEAVARLMDGEKAGLMNTDPPYGVGYANDDRPNPGVAKPRVANDSFKDSALQQFLESVFTTALAALVPSAAWYLWHAHLTQGFFAAAAAAAAHVILHRQIIWVKPVLLLGRGHYHWKHEPCFMGWVEGHQPPDYGRGNGERDQTTIWEVASVNQAERKQFNHSTPKPVGLFEIPIVKHLMAGEICYDPFAGSGPQYIAAEALRRRCYGLEIEPQYCDVIVTRWQNFTGKAATLDGDGRTFAEIAAERAA